jgi:hypothetical protein
VVLHALSLTKRETVVSERDRWERQR